MLGLFILFVVCAGLIIGVGTLAGLHFLTHPKRVTFATMVARGLPTSPAELGYDFRETTIAADDRTTIHAWVVQGKKPDGPVVVMTHGWADSRYGMITPLQAVGPVAGEIWMYDLRGQGESPAPASRLGTTEIDDLLCVLRQIESESPGRPVVLYGFSMGSGISIAAAARAAKTPERYPRILGIIGDGGYRLGMQPIEGFVKVNNLPSQPFLFLIKQHLAFWYCSDQEFDRARHASELKCPLLLMHGEADPICPLQAAQEIADAAPNARLEVFQEATHMDLYARDPDRYEALVRGFVEEVARGEVVSG